MLKRSLLLSMAILLISSLVCAADDGNPVTATAATVDALGRTFTSGSFEAVRESPYNPRPIPLNNALGIEIGMVSKVIPGLSYSRIFNPNISFTVFAGGILFGNSGMALVQFNGYYLFNDFLYVGLGVSGALDEDGSIILGFGNPSVGLMSAITDNIKIYIETTVLIFTYTVKADPDTDIGLNNPVPILKFGLKYYY
jgi:hypothetical protein